MRAGGRTAGGTAASTSGSGSSSGGGRVDELAERRVDAALEFRVADDQHDVVVARRQTDLLTDPGV